MFLSFSETATGMLLVVAGVTLCVLDKVWWTFVTSLKNYENLCLEREVRHGIVCCCCGLCHGQIDKTLSKYWQEMQWRVSWQSLTRMEYFFKTVKTMVPWPCIHEGNSTAHSFLAIQHTCDKLAVMYIKCVLELFLDFSQQAVHGVHVLGWHCQFIRRHVVAFRTVVNMMFSATVTPYARWQNSDTIKYCLLRVS